MELERKNPLTKWLKADTSAIEELKEKVTSFSNSTKRTPNLPDYMVLLAIAFGTVGLSHLGAEYISEFLTSNFEAVADKSSSLSSFASKFFLDDINSNIYWNWIIIYKGKKF